MSNALDKVEIELKLTVAQVNAVLVHLAKGSYSEVADLISDIRAQAMPQVAEAQKAPTEVPSPASVDNQAEVPPTAA